MSTRIALWTSLGAASTMNPSTFKSCGYTDIVMQAGYMIGGPGGGPSPFPKWGHAVVDEYHAAGVRCFLGSRLHGNGTPQPFTYDWLDNAAWANDGPVFKAIVDRVMLAKTHGFDGLAYDEELSGNNGEWVYGGDYLNPSHASRELVETVVFGRGARMNDVTAYLLGANVEVITYSNYWPRGWSNWIQHKVNKAPWPGEPTLQHHFWKGYFSRAHNGHVWMANADFYKSLHAKTMPDGTPSTWEKAARFDHDALKTYWRTFMPGVDLSKVHAPGMTAIVPIERADTNYKRAQPVANVEAQLLGVAKAADGLFVDYQYGQPYTYVAGNVEGKPPGTVFDLGPYVPALRAAAKV